MKSKLNLVKGNRIGSWEGTDVIFTTQREYDGFSDEKIKNKIYAFYNTSMPKVSTNMYMVQDDTVFAYIINEFGDIKLLRDDSFIYFGRLNRKLSKKEEPKANGTERIGSSVREIINKTEAEAEKVNKANRGKRAEIASQEEKVLGKSVDEWLEFAVSSSVADYTHKLSKNVDEIIRKVEN